MGGVYFNGQTVIRPQVRVAVDDSGLTPTVLGAANVLMMFGPSAGGQPNTVLSFSSPADAAKVLRSGELLTAMQAAWNPSPELPGAGVIKCVRVNPAVQGSITLKDAVPTNLMTLTSKDWGVYVNSIQVKVEAGSVSGKKITIQLASDNVTEVFDNLGTVAAAVAAINNATSGSSLVTAALVLEGTLATAAFASLTGGSDGTITNTQWSNAFALIAGVNVADVYCPVTGDASVHALLEAQNVIVSNAKYPGLVVAGNVQGETTSVAVARQSAYASDDRMILCLFGIKQYDANGNVVIVDAYKSFAPQMAGLICGLPIQRPPTFKVLSGLGLEYDLSQSDLDLCEQSGVCVMENVPNRGLRIVHGQTTWTADLNPGHREISVRRIANDISISLKQNLEAFVGEAGTTYTIAAIKAKVVGLLTEMQNAGLITAGVDSNGVAQPAFQEPVVSFNSATGICSVDVQCNPVTPVNFVLVTTHFKAVNIVA